MCAARFGGTAACALILLELPCRITSFQKPSSAKNSLQMLETSKSLWTEELGQLLTRHTPLLQHRRQCLLPRHRQMMPRHCQIMPRHCQMSSVLQGLTSQMQVIAAACYFQISRLPSSNALNF